MQVELATSPDYRALFELLTFNVSVTQFWREKVLRVAKEYPDILFAVADEESCGEKLKEFGLAESGEDVNVGLYDEHNRKFAMVDEEFSEDALKEFIDSWKEG